MNTVYGQTFESAEINTLTGSGSLKELAAFIAG
jgi:hypothetical protein